MVADPGAKVRTHRLRPLSAPRSVQVQVDGRGMPRALRLDGELRAVESVQDRWRIDDEWWREPALSRTYYQLLLAAGRVITVYRDRIGGEQ